MPIRPTPRAARSNLVWILGIASGLILGGVVAYELTGVPVAAVGQR